MTRKFYVITCAVLFVSAHSAAAQSDWVASVNANLFTDIGPSQVQEIYQIDPAFGKQSAYKSAYNGWVASPGTKFLSDIGPSQVQEIYQIDPAFGKQ